MSKRNVFSAEQFTDKVVEYVNVVARMDQLKEQTSRLKDEIVTHMKKHVMKTFIGNGVEIRLQSGSTRNFYGGYKKFAKAFGKAVADRWFEYRDYDKIVVKE